MKRIIVGLLLFSILVTGLTFPVSAVKDVPESMLDKMITIIGNARGASEMGVAEGVKSSFFELGTAPELVYIYTVVSYMYPETLWPYKKGDGDQFEVNIPAAEFERMVFSIFTKSDALVNKLHSSAEYIENGDSSSYKISKRLHTRVTTGISTRLYKAVSDNTYEVYSYEIDNSYTPSLGDKEGVDYVITYGSVPYSQHSYKKVVGGYKFIFNVDGDNVTLSAIAKIAKKDVPVHDSSYSVVKPNREYVAIDGYSAVFYDVNQIPSTMTGVQMDEKGNGTKEKSAALRALKNNISGMLVYKIFLRDLYGNEIQRSVALDVIISLNDYAQFDKGCNVYFVENEKATLLDCKEYLKRSVWDDNFEENKKKCHYISFSCKPGIIVLVPCEKPEETTAVETTAAPETTAVQTEPPATTVVETTVAPETTTVQTEPPATTVAETTKAPEPETTVVETTVAPETTTVQTEPPATTVVETTKAPEPATTVVETTVAPETTVVQTEPPVTTVVETTKVSEPEETISVETEAQTVPDEPVSDVIDETTKKEEYIYVDIPIGIETYDETTAQEETTEETETIAEETVTEADESESEAEETEAEETEAEETEAEETEAEETTEKEKVETTVTADESEDKDAKKDGGNATVIIIVVSAVAVVAAAIAGVCIYRKKKFASSTEEKTADESSGEE